jgi:hypothetical protein
VARRKRKEDEPEWTPPEFDEVGYMRKEIEGAKVAIVTIIWAFVGAVVAALLYDYVHPVVGFLLGLATFGLLYFLLPILGLPIAEFKRRDWTSHGVIYFFSWIAFWIILLNPPFADHTPPTIVSIEVGSFTAQGNATLPAAGVMWCVSASPGSTATISTGSNKTLIVLFRATDNVKVAHVNASVLVGSTTTYPNPIPVAGAPNVCKGQSGTFQDGTYAVLFPYTLQSTVDMTAWDTTGLSASASVSISA